MSRKREKQIILRLTEEEHKEFLDKLKESGLGQQEYLIKTALDKKITIIPGIFELAEQVRKIGININQITKIANVTGNVNDDDLRNLNDMVKKIWHMLSMVNQSKAKDI